MSNQCVENKWSLWLKEKYDCGEITMEKSVDQKKISGTLNFIPHGNTKIGDVVDVKFFQDKHCFFEDYNLLLFCMVPTDFFKSYTGSEDVKKCLIPSKDWNQQFIALNEDGSVMNKKQFSNYILKYL